MYHLSVSKVFLMNFAYAIALGIPPYLELNALSYSPHVAFIFSLSLSLALLLVGGVPF